MPKWIKTSGLIVVSVVTGFLAAYVFMASRMLSEDPTLKFIGDQNAAILLNNIDTLAHLRVGEIDYCIQRMENMIDSRVTQVAMLSRNSLLMFDPSSMSANRREALQLARVYVDAVPEVPLSEEGRDVLERVSPRERRYCSTALQALQDAALATDSE